LHSFAACADVRRALSEHGALLASGDARDAHLDAGADAAWTGPVQTLGAERAAPFGLEGDFALIALRSDGLVLARGLFGGRPLFHAWDSRDRVLLACNRLEPLARFLRPRPTLNVDDLGRRLLFTFDESYARTSYCEITRVQSGEILTITGPSAGNVAKLPFRIDDECAAKTPDEFADALRSRVIGAVERATKGESRVGVLVSGGIDSSVVLGALARARGANAREIDAIALDFAAVYPDRPYLRALTDALGIVPIKLSPEDCARHVTTSLVIDGAACVPPATPGNVAMCVAARERGARVVLTGMGGDDLLDFDARAFVAPMRVGAVLRAAMSASRLRAMYWEPRRLGRVDTLVARPLLRSLMPPALLRAWRASRRKDQQPPSWAGARLRALMREPAMDDASDEACASEDPPTTATRLRALAYSRYLTSVAETAGQHEVYSGCRRQDVFLDPVLASFVARIPPRLLTHGNYLRGLLRHAFRGDIPDYVRLRETKGEFRPAFAAFARALSRSKQFESLLAMSALGSLDLIRPTEFRAAFLRVLEDPMHATQNDVLLRLWPAFAAEAFAQSLRADVDAEATDRREACGTVAS
jgi:hypothetical protein